MWSWCCPTPGNDERSLTLMLQVGDALLLCEVESRVDLRGHHGSLPRKPFNAASAGCWPLRYFSKLSNERLCCVDAWRQECDCAELLIELDQSILVHWAQHVLSVVRWALLFEPRN